METPEMRENAITNLDSDFDKFDAQFHSPFENLKPRFLQLHSSFLPEEEENKIPYFIIIITSTIINHVQLQDSSFHSFSSD